MPWITVNSEPPKPTTFEDLGYVQVVRCKDCHKNLRQTRSRKHRYVYLVGDKRTKKRMRSELKYEVFDRYPKGDEVHYDPDAPKAVNPITYYEREEENNE